MPSIGEVLARNARRVPDRLALVYESVRMTYRELDDAVNRAARALAELGVVKGDRVGLMAFNSAEFIISYYGALRAGAIVVPLNVRLAPPELAYQLQDSGARLLLYDATLHPVVREALHEVDCQALPLLRTDHAVDDLPGPVFFERPQDQPADPPAVEVNEWDDAQILYTSGTTGRPKGVLLDHHRILWTGLNVITGVGLREGERLLHVAPLYHSAELDLFLMAGTYLASTHVVMKAFDPGAVIDTMERERITAFFGVPTMYQFMLRHPRFAEVDLSAWRVGMFGAAPMPPSVVTTLAERLPSVTLYNLCGLTEMGPGGVYLGGDDLREHPDMAGRPTLNTEARVVNDAGEDVQPGEVGELILRGETMMKGYWNKPEATAETIRDGWLYTGDLATVDEEGRVKLVDRKKDMIITGGMNVYSVEVENAVITHPAVADCAVIGVPHPDYGETVTAVVELRPGAQLTLEELREHCRPLISDYKIPRRLIIAPIPRNASGKILKYQLREQFRG